MNAQRTSDAVEVPLAPLFEVFAAAAGRGGGLTVVGPSASESRSYEELLERASIWAAGLAGHGIEPGHRVALFARTGFEFVVGCLSLWRRGAVVVPLPVGLGGPVSSSGRLSSSVVRRCAEISATAVLVTEKDPELGGAVTSIPVSSLEHDGVLSDEGPRLDDVALIQLSSGSTGRATAIALTHESLAWHLELLRRRFRPSGPSEEFRLLTWLPLFHDLALINYLLWPLALGSSACHLATEMFVKEPLSWLVEIGRQRASASAAPNFGYGMTARRLERRDVPPMDLSSWQLVGCGGEPVREETLRRFAEAAAPFGFDAEAFVPGYGLAEATSAVSAAGPGRKLRVDRIDRGAMARDLARPSRSANAAAFVSVGHPLDETEVAIADDEGTLLPERAIGEVRVRGPSLMQGYVDDAEATARALTNGWLRTGDRGYLSEGELFITGRVKDMIIVNGLNYYAEDIEHVAERVGGVRKGGCAAFGVQLPDGGEALVLLAEKQGGGDEEGTTVELLKTRVWTETGLAPREVVLLEPRTLPKTSSGKLRRHAARRMYESESLHPPTAS